jgi:16S rRNA (cytosine967-C5)-methyltransferase
VQVHEREKDLAHLVGKCDRVLIDAPCTGTGTWRRRPDTKWRLTQKNLDERIGQQRQVLDAAARYVRPGGMLCYVTCSLLPEENQQQAAHFVSANGDFEIVSALDNWQALFGASGVAPISQDGATVTLSPASTDTDGFFFAIMRRKGG